MFCQYCGLLRHDIKHCASYYVASKNEGKVDSPYGVCLKAMGRRSGSPVKQDSSSFSTSTKNMGLVNFHDYSGEEVQPPVAVGLATTNPNGDDGYVNGTNANMGTASDSQEVNAVKEGRSALVMDRWGANQVDINSRSLN